MNSWISIKDELPSSIEKDNHTVSVFVNLHTVFSKGEGESDCVYDGYFDLDEEIFVLGDNKDFFVNPHKNKNPKLHDGDYVTHWMYQQFPEPVVQKFKSNSKYLENQ